MRTTSSGRVVPRDPLECYVLQDHYIGTIKREEKKEPSKEESRSKEYVVEPMAEEDKPSREEIVKAREARRQAKKDAKKERSGQNKNRPITRMDLSERLCSSLVDVAPGEELPTCKFPKCRMMHDLPAFLKSKPPDAGPECYVFNTFGYCPRGVACRFAGPHVDSEGRNIRREGYTTPVDQSRLSKSVQIALRKRQYNFSKAEKVCQEAWDQVNANVEEVEREAKGNCPENCGISEKKLKLDNLTGNECIDNGEDEAIEEELTHKRPEENGRQNIGPTDDTDLIALRPAERKKLNWEGKTYLAPLTTVGNLPFRRVCKRLGVDITCGEMALSLPLLQGHTPEWALMKKHPSEDFFGVQVAGCSPPQMARLGQLLEERVDCDFVDINMGCPIDLIFKKGMGSGLMGRRRPMEAIVRSMSQLLTCPLTVKMRTGIYSDKHIAHEIFPLVEEWGASAVTLHGRSREQRYTRLADWEYIGQAQKTVKRIPVFGNGDVMSFEDHNLAVAKSGVSGIMVARGALIKPWIFTEIREQRHWDIQATERLEIVKEFCNYGLEHWGSDDKGVETTRRFLLEWQSFMYRYVPHGLLMFPPQKINERAPLFRGRNELETLLASPDSRDWVKITEMFLGKVPDHFVFLPKHKANSYS